MKTKILEQFSTNTRAIFLIDGLGALLSSILLVAVAYFEDTFGISKNVLYQLVPVPIVFTTYSLCCYVVNPQHWRLYLRIIALANILYCCLTLGLVYYYWAALTAIGVAYFLGEIVVVALLSSIELALSSSKNN
jgi:hypothetical protein